MKDHGCPARISTTMPFKHGHPRPVRRLPRASGRPLLLITALLLSVTVAACGSSKKTPPHIAVNVTAPADGSTVRASRVTVRGTVTPPDANVQVVGQAAQVGNGVFTASVPLSPGSNKIDVVATESGSSPATTAITVIRPRGRRARPTSGGGSPAPAPTATTGRSCGEGITVNSVTSCPFAIRVRDAYTSQGGPDIDVYSPVTGQTYTMTCTSGPGAQVTCRGGNNAVVTF
jgi:hypothetical protein